MESRCGSLAREQAMQIFFAPEPPNELHGVRDGLVSHLRKCGGHAEFLSAGAAATHGHQLHGHYRDSCTCMCVMRLHVRAFSPCCKTHGPQETPSEVLRKLLPWHMGAYRPVAREYAQLHRSLSLDDRPTTPGGMGYGIARRCFRFPDALPSYIKQKALSETSVTIIPCWQYHFSFRSVQSSSIGPSQVLSWETRQKRMVL